MYFVNIIIGMATLYGWMGAYGFLLFFSSTFFMFYILGWFHPLVRFWLLVGSILLIDSESYHDLVIYSAPCYPVCNVIFQESSSIKFLGLGILNSFTSIYQLSDWINGQYYPTNGLMFSYRKILRNAKKLKCTF